MYSLTRTKFSVWRCQMATRNDWHDEFRFPLSLPAVWLTVLSGHNGRPSKNRPYKYSTFLSRQQLVPGCAEAICNCFSRPGFEKLSLHQGGEGCGVVLIIVSFHSGKLLQINAKILCCGGWAKRWEKIPGGMNALKKHTPVKASLTTFLQLVENHKLIISVSAAWVV